MRTLLQEVLAEELNVETARNGKEGLELAGEPRPALVVSDIMMPGMDGHELMHRMRADPDLADTPIMLITARAGAGSRISGLEQGADEYLVKPFHARELAVRVRKLLERESRSR